MRSLMLEPKSLQYEIEAVEVQGCWHATIHGMGYSEGLAMFFWWNSPVPGIFCSAIAALRVANLFVMANVSGDRETLGSLSWTYRQHGVIFD